MNNDRIYMVTGAAGFLGSNICLQLLESNCKFRALVQPNDHALGETTRTVLQIIKGEMPDGMQGSFKLCDVRDLAAGTIAAADKGRVGECYILANETVTMKQICTMLQEECKAKRIAFYLPLGFANKIAQGTEKKYVYSDNSV